MTCVKRNLCSALDLYLMWSTQTGLVMEIWSKTLRQDLLYVGNYTYANALATYILSKVNLYAVNRPTLGRKLPLGRNTLHIRSTFVTCAACDINSVMWNVPRNPICLRAKLRRNELPADVTRWFEFYVKFSLDRWLGERCLCPPWRYTFFKLIALCRIYVLITGCRYRIRNF